MTQKSRHDGQLIGAVILIGLGVLFLLDELNYLRFGRVVSTFWPSILIVLGVWQFTCREPGARTGAIWLIGIGAFFQIARLDMFYWWRIRNFWPLILIAIGAWMLIERTRYRSQSPPPASPGAGSLPQQNP